MKTKRLLNLIQHKTNHGRKLRFHRKIYLQTKTYYNERKYRTESYKNIHALWNISVSSLSTLKHNFDGKKN